jgi:hypothetical protein
LCVAGSESLYCFAENVRSGFGDDLFGYISVLGGGVGASVYVGLGYCLAPGGGVSVVVEKALSRV